MKITVITGSAHRGGTSALLADRFIEGASLAGHEVYRFDAAFKQVHGCIGCEACNTKRAGCRFHDDMEELNPHIIESGGIVFVSPIYYYCINSQTKAVMDRFYANNERLRHGKRAALMMTMADDTMESAEGSTAFFRNLCAYMDWEVRGIIAATGCWTRRDIEGTVFPDRAYELGLGF